MSRVRAARIVVAVALVSAMTGCERKRQDLGEDAPAEGPPLVDGPPPAGDPPAETPPETPPAARVPPPPADRPPESGGTVAPDPALAPPPPAEQPAIVAAGPATLRVLAYGGATTDTRTLHYLERRADAADPAAWATLPVAPFERAARLTGTARLARTSESGLAVVYQAVFGRDPGAPTPALGLAVRRGDVFAPRSTRTSAAWPETDAGWRLSLGRGGAGVQLAHGQTTLERLRIEGAPARLASAPLATAVTGSIFTEAAAATDAAGTLHVVYTTRSTGEPAVIQLAHTVVTGDAALPSLAIPVRDCREVSGLSLAVDKDRGAVAAFLCTPPAGGCRVHAALLAGGGAAMLEIDTTETPAPCWPTRAARTSVALDPAGTAFIAYRRTDPGHAGVYDLTIARVKLGPTPVVELGRGYEDWSAATGAPLLATDDAGHVHVVYGSSAGLKEARVSPDGTTPALLPGVSGALAEPVDFIAEGR